MPSLHHFLSWSRSIRCVVAIKFTFKSPKKKKINQIVSNVRRFVASTTRLKLILISVAERIVEPQHCATTAVNSQSRKKKKKKKMEICFASLSLSLSISFDVFSFRHLNSMYSAGQHKKIFPKDYQRTLATQHST